MLSTDSTMRQASPWPPCIAKNRSDCSCLVGKPVEGPPRWTSTTTQGSSAINAMPSISLINARPGPEVAVIASISQVLGLDQGAAAFGQMFGYINGDFCCRCDGIGGEKIQSGDQRAEADGVVARHHDDILF